LHANSSGLTQFFQKPFVLWGRVFRTFYAKDETVFLFKTNEIFDATHIRPGHYPGLSLLQFLEWHNPLEYNHSQVFTHHSPWLPLPIMNIIRQWPNGLPALPWACLTLILAPWWLPKILSMKTTLVRICIFYLSYLSRICGLVSAKGDDMTDGCGSSNKAIHMDIHYTLKCDVYPVAVQFRLEGCKVRL
jgi:RNA-dependent RNA polymerase